MTLFFLAIAAGFLTILAPCILPVLPILLGTSGGRSRLRPVMVILGFITSFSLLGAAFATAGTFLGITNDALRTVAGVLLLIFGLALLFERVYDQLMASIQPLLGRLSARVSGSSATKTDALSGVLVGLSLGLVWTPCAGPILGTILTLASQTRDFLTTLFLFFAYALGAGIPMLGIAYGGFALQTRLKQFGRLQPLLNKIFGGIVVATAIGILTGYDRIIVAGLLQYFPPPSTFFNL
jgi:cytochrome c biogenesis protein CcdA